MIRVHDGLLLLLPVVVVETRDAGNILLEFRGADGYARRLTLDQRQLEAHALAMSAVLDELAQTDRLRHRVRAMESPPPIKAGPSGVVMPAETVAGPEGSTTPPPGG